MLSTASQQAAQRSTVVNQAAHLNLNRIVLYKRGHFIKSARSFFIIEISTTAEGTLYIAAYDIQSNTSFLMQQKPEKAKQTLARYQNDFQSMAEAVQISFDGTELYLSKSGPLIGRRANQAR